MTKLEQQQSEVREILEYRKIKYDNEPAVLIDRLTMLNVYLARSGELKANIQFLYDLQQAKEVESLTDLQPMKLREVLKGKLALENYALTLADRLNATIVHQIDSIRSQLSYMKAEIHSQQ